MGVYRLGFVIKINEPNESAFLGFGQSNQSEKEMLKIKINYLVKIQ